MSRSVPAIAAALWSASMAMAMFPATARSAPRGRPAYQSAIKAPVRRAVQPALAAPAPAAPTNPPAGSIQAVPDPLFGPQAPLPDMGSPVGPANGPNAAGAAPWMGGHANPAAAPFDPHGSGLMHGGAPGFGMHAPAAAGYPTYRADYPPPRVLSFGWPSMRVSRRDLPLPRKKKAADGDSIDEDPRKARLEIYAPAGARVFVDEEELFCDQGAFRAEPEKPLIPGFPETRDVRVESYDESGLFQERVVTVYLRMGRLTQLFFE